MDGSVIVQRVSCVWCNFSLVDPISAQMHVWEALTGNDCMHLMWLLSHSIKLMLVIWLLQGMSEDVSINKFFDDPMLLELARQDADLQQIL